MNFRHFGRLSFLTLVLAGLAAPAAGGADGCPGAGAQGPRHRRRPRRVQHHHAAGIPVEVVGGETVYTDVDGRYVARTGARHLRAQGRRWTGTRRGRSRSRSTAGARVIDANVGLTMARFAETVTVTAPRRSGRRHLVGRSAADRAQERAGHHRQPRLAGDEDERRHRCRGRDVARHRPVGRRQPVRVRARSRRALQQHHAGRLDAADDRAGQEGRAARSVPGGPARQRPGEQVVLAGSVGGVRRRPGADSPAQVAEPRRSSTSAYGISTLLERHRQVAFR